MKDNKGGVRFIRKNGRVIPIRGDKYKGGAKRSGMKKRRKSSGYKTQKRGVGERAKYGARKGFEFGAKIGGAVGGIGAAASLASGSGQISRQFSSIRGGKAKALYAIGAAGGAALGTGFRAASGAIKTGIAGAALGAAGSAAFGRRTKKRKKK
jgi:hypothetical protein